MVHGKSLLEIGTILRERRKHLNLTLKDVGKTCGISAGFLSQVERNLTSPSLSTLVNIAQALGVGVDYFLAPPKTTGLVNRKQERSYFAVDGLPVRYARVSNEIPRGKLTAVISEVPAHWESEHVAHTGEDFMYVIEGTGMVKVGDEEYILHAGDTIHYDASIPHSLGNQTDKPIKILFVGTQPLFPTPTHSKQPGQEPNGTT